LACCLAWRESVTARRVSSSCRSAGGWRAC